MTTSSEVSSGVFALKADVLPGVLHHGATRAVDLTEVWLFAKGKLVEVLQICLVILIILVVLVHQAGLELVIKLKFTLVKVEVSGTATAKN